MTPVPEKVVEEQVVDRTLEAIILCESGGNPRAVGINYRTVKTVNPDGKPIEFKEAWSRDWGLLQVSDYYWKEEMEEVGLDITNPVDSFIFGKMLYEKQGVAPWSASAKCRDKKLIEWSNLERGN